VETVIAEADAVELVVAEADVVSLERQHGRSSGDRRSCRAQEAAARWRGPTRGGDEVGRWQRRASVRLPRRSS
jgi:hypothetical protein